MFDTTKKSLRDLLEQAHEGKLQLPDFQRDYVWGDDDVRSLIASVAKGYPVGALLSLQTGGSITFKPRVLEGVNVINAEPEELLLDGQQRLTSLYQAVFSSAPVRTRNDTRRTEIKRYYYLDIKVASKSGADIEEAIVGVPEDKIKRKNLGRDIVLDLSTQEREFKEQMFPLNKVFNNSKGWFYNWRDYWKNKGMSPEEILHLDTEFNANVLDNIDRYQMPLIRLDKNNTRESICLVFEKVNVGGKKLDAFELLTAIFASNDFDLREDWFGERNDPLSGRRQKIIGPHNQRDVLKGIANTDFLRACTLLNSISNREFLERRGIEELHLPQISCNRNALLSLPLDGYTKHADDVQSGMIEAAKFLNEQNIIAMKDIPYPSIIVGLASIFAILGKDAVTINAKSKICKWFWSITLGELFGSSTDSRLARDIPEVNSWIKEIGPEPYALGEAVFQQERLRSLRTRRSAAYKGIHALLMREGCRDFITNQPTDIMTFHEANIDIHHIFPKRWCEANGIPSKVYDSIVNKTPLSSTSNKSIGGRAPSEYLQRIEQRYGVASAVLDEILRSHLIDPKHMRNDDFDAFFETRIQQLSKIIGNAMDKAVIMESGADEPELEIDNDFEELDTLADAA